MSMKGEEAHRIRRNLADAVCPDAIIEDYMELWANGRTADQVGLLQKHRKNLLGSLHQYQKALDCLDYLLFTTEKQRQSNES